MAPYRVKTPDGELKFLSLYDVEKAWLNALISEEDEVLDESTGRATKAGAMPLLAQALKEKQKRERSGLPLGVMLSIALSLAALVLLWKQHYFAGFLLAVGAASFLFQISTRRKTANKRQ